MPRSDTPQKTVPTGASRAVRPQARTAERREAILEAAMAVFGSRGYHNGSLMEIADQAGMTHAGVLHHFGSKEKLLIAVLEYRDKADVADLEGHHAPRGAELLKHLVNTANENTSRAGIIQAYAVLSGESVTDGHPAQAFFQERLAGLRSMVSDALAEVSGRAQPDEATARGASVIVAAMDGLQVQWLLDPSSVDMPSAVQAVVDMVQNSLISPT